MGLPLNVLGLNLNHETSAAVYTKGRIVAAACEERFNREKHSSVAPVQSIAFCLRQANLSMEDIDAVSVNNRFVDESVSWPALLHAFLRRETLAGCIKEKLRRTRDRWLGKPVPALLPGRNKLFAALVQDVQKTFPALPELEYVQHHLTHAASAFYPSGFKEAAVVTVDGIGENDSTVAWAGQNNRLTRLRTEYRDSSLGLAYQMVTQYLGFPFRGEGQLMGLAPFGQPNPEVMEPFRQRVFDPKRSTWYWITKEFQLIKWNKPAREAVDYLPVPPVARGETLTPAHKDLAFAVQKNLEEALVNVVRWTLARTGSSRLCLAGGVALNCSANGALAELNEVKDLFVFPAAHDSGGAVGGALALAAAGGEKPHNPLMHDYLGPEYSAEEIRGALREAGLKAEDCGKGIVGRAAELLAQDKIVGWFQGRAEFGPRALGNRSLLVNPCKAENHAKMNRVKGRQPWRPIAPSLLNEARSEYLENARESRFMLLCFKVSEEKRGEIPAVVHVDGSTRPQTVHKETNPRYHALLRAFEGLSSHPVLGNTSFNLAGEPIVNVPADAIASFKRSDIDALAIGDYLVCK